MEALFEKIKSYVKMDTEISAEEFQAYYKSVMDKLTAAYDGMSERELLQGKMITSILSANAGTRGKRKNTDAKKFRKRQEKSQFWSDAIAYRLKKSWLSEDEISEKTAALEEEM